MLFTPVFGVDIHPPADALTLRREAVAPAENIDILQDSEEFQQVGAVGFEKRHFLFTCRIIESSDGLSVFIVGDKLHKFAALRLQIPSFARQIANLVVLTAHDLFVFKIYPDVIDRRRDIPDGKE